jgi:hypothetical protein
VNGRDRVLADLNKERDQQDEMWGPQYSHPDGTGGVHRWLADSYRDLCQANFDAGEGTFADILLEEVFEAMAESDPVLLRGELVQAGAVIVKWIEAIDRREEDARQLIQSYHNKPGAAL